MLLLLLMMMLLLLLLMMLLFVCFVDDVVVCLFVCLFVCSPGPSTFQWWGRFVLSTWGVVWHWLESVGSMPRRHERDVQDVMKQIARELRAARDASLDHGPTTLQARAQALRDISGLCRRGLVRMAISALERGLERSMFARMRQSQAVQDILTYLAIVMPRIENNLQ